jgi:hydroxyacylglutathione hydrolase
VPSLLGEEKQTNPFLRADLPGVQKAVGMVGKDPALVFAEVRHRKDVFR